MINTIYFDQWIRSVDKLVRFAVALILLLPAQDKLVLTPQQGHGMAYTCLAESDGLSDGSGNLLSRCSKILSLSWIHWSPSRRTGIRPLGLFLMNLRVQDVRLAFRTFSFPHFFGPLPTIGERRLQRNPLNVSFIDGPVESRSGSPVNMAGMINKSQPQNLANKGADGFSALEVAQVHISNCAQLCHLSFQVLCHKDPGGLDDHTCVDQLTNQALSRSPPPAQKCPYTEASSPPDQDMCAARTGLQVTRKVQPALTRSKCYSPYSQRKVKRGEPQPNELYHLLSYCQPNCELTLALLSPTSAERPN
jgi:hypothetical protein